MIRNVLLAALVICGLSTLTIAQHDPRDIARTAARLRSVGQAIQMYAAENKAHLPADLGLLKPYLKGETEAVARDFAYSVKPGTRIMQLRPAAQTPLVTNKPKGDEALVVLFVDGHVVAYAPIDLAQAARAAIAVAATQQTRTTIAAPAAAVPTTMPQDMAAALVGGLWAVDVGAHVATYQFNADGGFTLRFSSPKMSHGIGQASGTWKLDGRKLVMSNTASDTPFTVVGEEEHAEVIGLNENVLVLRTLDAKGKAEDTVLRRGIVLKKGQHDNPKILGTWNGHGMTLVLAESGMMVLGSLKGQWTQHRERLNLMAGNREGTGMLDLHFTIDLVDDTTLVLTVLEGKFMDKQPPTMTFLRVK